MKILLAATLLTLASCGAVASTAPAALLQLDVTRAGARLLSVGDRGQVLYSDDQGHHWQPARTPTQQLLTAVFFVDADHGWAVGHDAQVLATSDAGAHWALQFEDPAREAPLLDIWFRDRDHGLAVGAYGALLRTDDGGGHWRDIGQALDNPDQLHLNAITAVEGGALFIVGEAGGVFRSLDDGATWQTLPAPYEGSLFGILATGQPDTLLVYGLRGHVYRSADNGEHWQSVPIVDVQDALTGGSLLENGTLVLVGNAGTLLHSDDGGRSFILTRQPDRQAFTSVVPSGDGALILAGQGGVKRVSSAVAVQAQP